MYVSEDIQYLKGTSCFPYMLIFVAVTVVMEKVQARSGRRRVPRFRVVR